MWLLGVSSVKLVAEIALLALLGRGLLGLMAGAGRERNPFYQLLQVLTRPFERVVRALTPRVVLDAHVPLATFAVLALVWLLATLAKIALCVELGVAACRG
ncbi:YggT family protein [Caldimonas tepidiphila]|uniref:YggT family protein n=1 Tax=Caldimonas tepidiphila TaxID=2315841 RepID=UPI000E5A3DE4|nr:YggT family protein [Caldimonas tepidiphila]